MYEAGSVLTGLFRTKIFRRQLAALLGLSLAPLMVATWVTVSQGRAEIRRQTQAQLEAAERGAEAQVREFLAFIRTRTSDFAADVYLMDQVVRLSEEQAPPEPWTTPRALELSQYLSQRKLPLLPEATEVFILDMHGTVMASSSKAHLGVNHASSDYFLKGQQSVFLSDIFREPSGELTWVVAAPLRSGGEGPVGILVNRISPRVLSDITTGRRAIMLGASDQSMRIGETGETYLVNQDKQMITESRFVADAPLNLRVDTLSVRKAFERSSTWEGDYPDYRGVPISGVATFIQDTNWVLLTEIDTSQATEPVNRLRNTLLAFALGLSLVVVVVAGLLSKQLIGPIRRIVTADVALVEGRPTEGIIPENEIPNDEIGAIVRARHRVLDELARGQAELRQADRLVAVGTLAAGMAHEVNSPLTFIMANVDLAANEVRANGPDEPWVHDVLAMLNDARKGAERVQVVVQDLRSFTIGTESELPLSLHAAVDMALKLTAGEVRQRARVTKVFDPVPRVVANEGHLGQVLVNLVLNAAQAFTESGDNEIVIHTRTAADGKAVVEVTDNGPGIPPGVRARIFDPFFTTKPVGAGAGLGLFVCNKIVTSLGGSLVVESEFGKGATFRLTLPAAPEGSSSSEVDTSLGLPN